MRRPILCTKWTDIVEFQQDLAGDLKMVLLDVFERNQNALVQTNFGEDLTSSSCSDSPYSRYSSSSGWFCRVVGAALVVTRLINASLRFADAAS